MNRQQTQMLVENLAKQQPALVEEVVPKMYSYGEVQRILVGLLKENVPIRNLAAILEALADNGQLGHNMFQQSYSVASRMVTTIDEMLNTLINSTGRVGL